MDERRNPFFALDVLVAFSDTEHALHKQFGAAGPLAWHYLIAAAKRAPIQGTVTYTSPEGFWTEIGLDHEDWFDVDEFLDLLGRQKQTRRQVRHRRHTGAEDAPKTRRRGATDVTLTNFETWQKLPRRHNDAARKRTKRQGTRETDTADTSADNTADDTADKRSPERRGEETTITSLPTRTVRESDDDAPPPLQAASARLPRGNGRVPADEVPAYNTVEHHKHYRPDKAEQYARNVGAALTQAELARDLEAEFDGIPADTVQALLVHAGQTA